MQMTYKQVLNVGIFVCFFLVIGGCKKVDYAHHDEYLEGLTSGFFLNNRSSSSEEAALVDYIKRENHKLNFVEKTVKIIGYPYWSKAIKTRRSFDNPTNRNDLDSSTHYYIPFVRDNENYVNAAMVIEVSSNDTTFGYKCDWQYKQQHNNSYNVMDSAEHFAIFFMSLDKAVFGTEKFRISDTSLFRGENGPSKIISLESANNTIGDAYYEWTESCQDVVVFVQYCQFPDSDQCRNGCDWCSQCVSSNHYTYCWGEYIWIGDGGGGNGSGGTSGGGGSGGGGTPPECDIIPLDPYVLRVQPCENGPGWTPLPSLTPCQKAIEGAKQASLILRQQLIQSHKVTMTTNIETATSEKMFLFGKVNSNDIAFTASPIITGPDNAGAVGIPPTWPGMTVFGGAHTHTPIGYNAPSAGDIYLFMQNNSINSEFNFLFTFSQNNNNYVFTITKPSSFTLFAQNFPYNNYFDMEEGNWKNGTLLRESYENVKTYFVDIGKSEDEAVELAMAYVMEKWDMGISIAKQDSNGDFKPFFVRETPDPSNPNKKIFIQTIICNEIIISDL